jgi:hypothetical protein
MVSRSATHCPQHLKSRRRSGLAVLKVILLIPIILTLLALILEVGNLWIARLEFENALESAALAAVKEWGDANGASGTYVPRQVGNEFARSNTVRWNPVVLTDIDSDLNWDPSDTTNNPNENRTCPEGVLVFGAITDFDPEVIFNAGVRPGCGGAGSLLFDVSEQGNTGAENAWGISFRATDDSDVNANLRVDRIIIDVDPSGTGEARFNFTSSPPILSDNLTQPAVRDTSGNSQPDNLGFTLAPNAPTTQIFLSPVTGTPSQLEITFGSDGSDLGFSPGDRFRFGALVEKRESNTYQQANGDDIGQIHAKVTVFFSYAGIPTSASSEGFYFDNATRGLDRDSDCNNPAIQQFDPVGNLHWVVHGRQIPDLPCPPTSSATNNGQSFVVLDGAGQGRTFAVQAQGEFEVPMVISQLFGCDFGPFVIQGEAFAYYNCEERRPCLIRIDQTLCPSPSD